MNCLWSNAACRLEDLGEGVLGAVLCAEDQVISGLSLDGLERGLQELLAGNWLGLVLTSAGPHFALGASLPVLWENFEQGQWAELEARGRRFQGLNLALASSPRPVVAAVRGYALGGGCELAMHCRAVLAQPAARFGLVESRAGILPAAGGCKEMSFRARTSDQAEQALVTLTRGLLAGDAAEAFQLGYLRPGIDRTGSLDQARELVLQLAQQAAPKAVTTFSISCGHDELLAGLERQGGWSRFDRYLGQQAAYLLSGGRARGEPIEVQQLLDLEREVLRELGTNPRTRARMRYLLQAGLIQQLQNPES